MTGSGRLGAANGIAGVIDAIQFIVREGHLVRGDGGTLRGPQIFGDVFVQPLAFETESDKGLQAFELLRP
jgi:hypothetical protein